MVIIVDDEDRENEGDLMVAAEKVTPETINFMATHGRGLICLPDDRTAARRTAHSADGFRLQQYVAVRHGFLRLHRSRGAMCPPEFPPSIARRPF